LSHANVTADIDGLIAKTSVVRAAIEHPFAHQKGPMMLARQATCVRMTADHAKITGR